MTHYAALVVAENPLEDHRQFVLRQQNDEAGDPDAAPPGAWDTEAQHQGPAAAAAAAARATVPIAGKHGSIGGGETAADPSLLKKKPHVR